MMARKKYQDFSSATQCFREVAQLITNKFYDSKSKIIKCSLLSMLS